MPQISKAFLRITAITPQKKKDRFNIFLDDKFAFGANLETIVKNNLKAGMLISVDKVNKVIGQEKSTKLLDLATRYLSYRPRSVKEVENYLASKIAKSEQIKFREAKESRQIPIIVQKLKRYKYLNDRQFAKWFFTSRQKSSPRGLSYVKMELKLKGISSDIIEGLAVRSSELELAKKAVAKKLKRWQAQPLLDFKKKFYSYLKTRGFSYDTIRELFANLTKNG